MLVCHWVRALLSQTCVWIRGQRKRSYSSHLNLFSVPVVAMGDKQCVRDHIQADLNVCTEISTIIILPFVLYWESFFFFFCSLYFAQRGWSQGINERFPLPSAHSNTNVSVKWIETSQRFHFVLSHCNIAEKVGPVRSTDALFMQQIY